jgi:hypothetical protein
VNVSFVEIVRAVYHFGTIICVRKSISKRLSQRGKLAKRTKEMKKVTPSSMTK